MITHLVELSMQLLWQCLDIKFLAELLKQEGLQTNLTETNEVAHTSWATLLFYWWLLIDPTSISP